MTNIFVDLSLLRDKISKNLKRPSFIILTAVLVISGFFIVSVNSVMAAAIEIWVAPTGDDANLGTEEEPFLTIQKGIDTLAEGGTVNVADGTYIENVTIDKTLTLLSTSGRADTTIQGDQALGGELGTVFVTNNTDNVQIGDIGQGFTIIGIDGPCGLEKAAVYFQGGHSNAVIKGNNIVANGDAGLLTEWGATITGFVISNNEFSGKTFVGDTPGGDGFGEQFTVDNVPRQLANMGGGSGGGNTSDITFTDNHITGIAGGINIESNPQGNTLLTIDSDGSTITGNVFEGTTTHYGTSLRARGPGATITGNDFRSTGLTTSNGHLYLENNPIDSALIAANTFDKGVYVESASGGPIGLSIQAFVSAVLSGTTINVAAGEYDENVVISKSLYLVGAGVETTTIDGNNVGNTVTITASDVTLTGFKITGGYANGGNIWDPYGGVVIDGNGGSSALTNIVIDDNIIDSNAGNGIYVSAAGDGGPEDNIKITNCIISNNGGSTSFFGGITITYGWFDGGGTCDLGPSEPYDDWRRPKNVLIEGNELSNDASTGYVYGIYINGGQYNTIRSNNIHGFSSKGLLIAASMPCTAIPSEYTTVENNQIYNNARNGIKLVSWNQYNTFTGNNIYNNGFGYTGPDDSFKYGFQFKDGNNNIIQNNTITGNALGGLYLWGNGDPSYTWYSTTNNVITGNTISDHTTAGGRGIYIPVNQGYPNSGFLNSNINQNNITNNLFGLENADTTQTIDATLNWWGDAVTTTTAIAPLISGAVDYSPWLVTSPITGTAPNIVVSDHPWTWYTNDSIQDAIDAATTSDTINVAAGMYTVDGLVADIYKSDLTLKSTDGPEVTIIQSAGMEGDGAVRIRGANDGTPTTGVTVDGFTVYNTGTANSGAGIFIGGWFAGDMNHLANNNTVKNCIIGSATDQSLSPTNGVYLWNTTGNIIQSNIIYKARNEPADFGCGIMAWGGLVGQTAPSPNTQIIDNKIYDSDRYGVFIGAATQQNFDNMIVRGNTITGSGTRGIGLWNVLGCDTIHINLNNIYDSVNEDVWAADCDATVDATNNWWGSAKPNFNTIVSGDVNCSPWYANQEMTSLAGTPDENNQLTLSTEVEINVTTTVDDVTVDVTVEIPAEVTVTGEEGWTGEINAPEVKSNSSVTVIPERRKTATVSAVIEIGYGDVKLTFSKAVRISIAGQAGKYAGYSRMGIFTPITTICNDDDQTIVDAQLGPEGDCKIDVYPDLVIWTKHFTKFIAYTQTSIVAIGGGTTGIDTIAPSISAISVIARSNSATISWQTNESSLTWIVYGTSTDYGEESKTTSYTTSHSVTLSNLSPETTYHYQIKSKDSNGNIGSYTDKTFTTSALEEKITGDINGDNKVDISDFNLLIVNWGDSPSNLAADLDGNGKVDIFDFNLLMVNWW